MKQTGTWAAAVKLPESASGDLA